MSPSLCSRTVKTGPVRSHKYVVVSSYEKYKNSQNIWSAFQKVKEVILLSSTSNYERSTIFYGFQFPTIGFPVAVPHRLPGKPDKPERKKSWNAWSWWSFCARLCQRYLSMERPLWRLYRRSHLWRVQNLGGLLSAFGESKVGDSLKPQRNRRNGRNQTKHVIDCRLLLQSCQLVTLKVKGPQTAQKQRRFKNLAWKHHRNRNPWQRRTSLFIHYIFKVYSNSRGLHAQPQLSHFISGAGDMPC